LPKLLDSLRKLAEKQPENFYLKTDLAHAYYLDQDVSNAHYQFWQVYNHLQKHPNIKLNKYVDDLLAPELDTTGRSIKRPKTSQYALIAFPMMEELKQTTLYSMDCQDYDLNWNASWAAFDAKFNAFKNDTTSSIKQDLALQLDHLNNGFKKYEAIEKSSEKVTEWLNSDEASNILASGDFYLTEMYSINNFPVEEMRSKIHWGSTETRVCVSM